MLKVGPYSAEKLNQNTHKPFHWPNETKNTEKAEINFHLMVVYARQPGWAGTQD